MIFVCWELGLAVCMCCFLGSMPAFSTSFPPANVFRGMYRYTRDLLQLDSCHPQSVLSLQSCSPSPIVIDQLSYFLSSHPDVTFAAFIMRGMTHGFRIGFDRSHGRLRSLTANHPSSLANGAVVEEYIASEVALGRLVGPVMGDSVSSGIHISPIGLVPKAHQFNRWRMIVDLSSPHGQSVNDGISTELSSIQYSSMDEAVGIILSMGQGTQLVKIDLKDAYRMVPVHPDDHHLLGISWGGSVYIDRCLPFGLRSALKIFSAV